MSFQIRKQKGKDEELTNENKQLATNIELVHDEPTESTVKNVSELE